MTLRCANCGSYGLTIVNQSYSDDSAFETYECEDCNATGSLRHSAGQTTLMGAVERDGGRL